MPGSWLRWLLLLPKNRSWQVFWLVLEVSAGNEDSRGYVRVSSVVLWALVLHVLAHFLLLRCINYSHHAQEFTLDLVTDVVGFAWINVAEEMLAQARLRLAELDVVVVLIDTIFLERHSQRTVL